MEGAESKVILEYPERKTNISIVAKIWGVSGNHEMTTICEVKGKKVDSSQAQIFYTSEIYYRAISDDSLLVYAPESSFLTMLDSIGSVKLKVIPIRNAANLDNLAKNYQSKGLLRLSAYDKKRGKVR
jgi:hypothetical protein